jgi:hypothetical protein
MPALKIPRKWYTQKITSGHGSARDVKRKIDLKEIRNDDGARGRGEEEEGMSRKRCRMRKRQTGNQEMKDKEK